MILARQTLLQDATDGRFGEAALQRRQLGEGPERAVGVGGAREASGRNSGRSQHARTRSCSHTKSGIRGQDLKPRSALPSSTETQWNVEHVSARLLP